MRSDMDERYPIPGSQRAPATKLMQPFDLQRWIADNRSKLRPPVGAELVFEASEDYIVFVVGGPNQRSDYHVNNTEEFFYQLEGSATLKVVVDGRFEDVVIPQGSIFLLPANVPHSPQRGPDTVGLVLERRRTADMTDRLRWFAALSTWLRSFRLLMAFPGTATRVGSCCTRRGSTSRRCRLEGRLRPLSSDSTPART